MTARLILEEVGVRTDITDKVRSVFEGLPRDWDDWVDEEAVITIADVALAIGYAETGRRGALARQRLAEAKERAERYQREREETQRRRAEQKALQRRASAAMTDHLFAIMPRLIAGERGVPSEPTGET